MLLRFAAASLLLIACVDDTSQDTQASTIEGEGEGCNRPPHGPPPPESFDACESLAAGDTCAFDIDGHHVEGTCKTGPDGEGELACAPERRPPPPEAFEACTGLAAGDTCGFEIDGHSIEGTCMAGPDGTGTLGCAPDQPPPGP